MVKTAIHIVIICMAIVLVSSTSWAVGRTRLVQNIKVDRIKVRRHTVILGGYLGTNRGDPNDVDIESSVARQQGHRLYPGYPLSGNTSVRAGYEDITDNYRQVTNGYQTIAAAMGQAAVGYYEINRGYRDSFWRSYGQQLFNPVRIWREETDESLNRFYDYKQDSPETLYQMFGTGAGAMVETLSTVITYPLEKFTPLDEWLGAGIRMADKTRAGHFALEKYSAVGNYIEQNPNLKAGVGLFEGATLASSLVRSTVARSGGAVVRETLEKEVYKAMPAPRLLDRIVNEANLVAAPGGKTSAYQKRVLAENLPVVARRNSESFKSSNKMLRTEFNKQRNKIIAQWEKNNKRVWPVVNGRPAPLHHIIPLESGGANKWWNSMPVVNGRGNHSLNGVQGPHAREGVLRESIQAGPTQMLEKQETNLLAPWLP